MIGCSSLATLVLGAVAAGAVYVVSRRAGRNEVFAGGAADAAYGSLPQPSQGAPPPSQPCGWSPTARWTSWPRSSSCRPKGIEPWQGAVLLNEKIDRTTVAAWVSGLVAKDAITLTQEDDDLVIRRGPHHDQLDADTKLISQMLDYKDELTLGTYNPNFGKAWNDVQSWEKDTIAASGWWKRLPPGTGGGCSASTWLVAMIALFVFFGGGSLLVALLGTFRGKIAALAFALVVPAIIAHFIYRLMAPARSATGSALALRAESFRRFLAASEGQHVDWAWKQGLLREYSAAVALGAADAWGRALATATCPRRR